MSTKRARLAAAVALTLALAGCSARGATLGTTQSPCFRALPAAEDAVAAAKTFLGVRRTTTGGSPAVPRAVRQEGPSRTVCLVAYRGVFTSAEVSKPRGANVGSYAVVVVSADGKTVLATILSDRLPQRFRHL